MLQLFPLSGRLYRMERIVTVSWKSKTYYSIHHCVCAWNQWIQRDCWPSLRSLLGILIFEVMSKRWNRIPVIENKLSEKRKWVNFRQILCRECKNQAFRCDSYNKHEVISRTLWSWRTLTVMTSSLLDIAFILHKWNSSTLLKMQDMTPDDTNLCFYLRKVSKMDEGC
jgi:hypothetical protein